MSQNIEMNSVLDRELISVVERLGKLQESDGSITRPSQTIAIDLLRRIAREGSATANRCSQATYADALVADIETWIADGLERPPDFSGSRVAITSPKDGDPFFFVGPLRLANGGRVGWRFETFLSIREEPTDLEYLELYRRYPHPKNICQSSHLIDGSSGMIAGNNIVFFPENIQSKETVELQEYAVFFFNKFYRIYNEITLPTVTEVVGNISVNNPTFAKPRDCYMARCVWGYLHDYFHHQGVRPFDVNVTIKTRWFTGLLEEIKVDLQSYLSCLSEEIADADTVAEFILLDRMFRYPREPDWYRNFDSGTGLILLAFLGDRNALNLDGNGRIILDHDRIPDAAASFVREVEALESLSDEEYPPSAKEMVYRYLPPGEGHRRFDRPAVVAASALANMATYKSLTFTYEDLKKSRHRQSLSA